MYIQFGREFGSTIEKYNKAGIGPRIKKRVDKFVEFKKENPTEMFGANDKPFTTNSPYKGLYTKRILPATTAWYTNTSQTKIGCMY